MSTNPLDHRPDSIRIEKAEAGREAELLLLYKKVALLADGIIRRESEIDLAYIAGFVAQARQNGLMLFALSEEKIVGEIHAYTPGIYAFQHLLTDLTIVVDPEYQGMGIGRALFSRFLQIVQEEFPHILRIELFTREHNERNLRFYESLGFINEGRQQHKIFMGHSSFETPVHMAWFNPAYRSPGS